MAEDRLGPLPGSLQKYFNNETFSDVTIICKGREFKAHRLILSIHSDIFAKAFSGPWKESSEGKMELGEVEDTVVEAMLRFMYSFEYNNAHGTSTMVFHTQVYGLADKYAIPSLKDHARAKFQIAIGSGWALDDFSLAIAEAYSSTPDGDRALRDLIVGVVVANVKELVKNQLFEHVVRETPGFAFDMIESLASDRKKGKNTDASKCGNCAKIMHGDFTKGTNFYCMHCGNHRSDWRSRIVGE